MMSLEALAAHIREVAERPLGEISPASRLVEDLGLDSLELVEVLVALPAWDREARLLQSQAVLSARTVADLHAAVNTALPPT